MLFSAVILFSGAGTPARAIGPNLQQKHHTAEAQRKANKLKETQTVRAFPHYADPSRNKNHTARTNI
jgi:hypothetical protein